MQMSGPMEDGGEKGKEKSSGFSVCLLPQAVSLEESRQNVTNINKRLWTKRRNDNGTH